jgi:hypothetical protein
MGGLPLPYFEVLGRLTTAYAALEAETTEVLWALLGTDHDNARKKTSRMSLMKRLELLEELATKRVLGLADASALAQIEAIVKDAGEAVRQRNRTVHAVWLLAPEEGGPLQWNYDQRESHEETLRERQPDEINREATALGLAREGVLHIKAALEQHGVKFPPIWIH